jgi:flagellar motor protein MotB
MQPPVVPGPGDSAVERSLLDRMFPLLHIAALALAAGGVGFAIYVYTVPYRQLLTELKRRSGEVRQVKTADAGHKKEIDRLRQDLVDAKGQSSQSLGEEGRHRSAMKFLKAQLQDRLKDSGAVVQAEGKLLRLRFGEDAMFDARGAVLGKAGQAVLLAMSEVVAAAAVRVLVSAPMAGAGVPKWARAEFASPGDLSMARVRNVVRHLTRVGMKPESVVGVIVGAAAVPSQDPTLDIEIEP